MDHPTNSPARWQGRLTASALAKPAKLGCSTPSPSLTLGEQNRLVEAYLPLARSMARPLKETFRRLADDLESAACLALVQAARRYDPSLGAFGTYAAYRISGELAHVLRADNRLKRQAAQLVDGEPRGRVMGPSPASPVEDELERRDQVERLLEALDDREATVCRMKYFDGKSQGQIAGELGCSQTLVSRLEVRSLRLMERGLAC